MNWVDVVIVVLVIAAVGNGLMSGALTQALSLGGLAPGAFLGADLAPTFTRTATNPNTKAVIALVCVFGTAGLLAAAGRVLGSLAARRLRATPRRSIDAGLGVLTAVVVTLVVA